jgi:hypothetical protein
MLSYVCQVGLGRLISGQLSGTSTVNLASIVRSGGVELARWSTHPVQYNLSLFAHNQTRTEPTGEQYRLSEARLPVGG